MTIPVRVESQEQQPSVAEFQWFERPWLNRPDPESGKTWVTREMVSYQTGLNRFIPHLQAMGEGLESPYFTQWGDFEDDDDGGVFVVGLRDTTAEDEAKFAEAAKHKEAEERLRLSELLEKYGPLDSDKKPIS